MIEVADDGRGDRHARRCARAPRRKGIVAAAATCCSERETLDLIFAPGISTRSEVTETSGRGVGMDVVHTNLTALGGVVDVESTPGRGTTISMTLPITLAIIQSLIVVVARQRFAIPLNAVLETLLIDGPADPAQRRPRAAQPARRGRCRCAGSPPSSTLPAARAGGEAVRGRDRPRRQRAWGCSSTGSMASRTP